MTARSRLTIVLFTPIFFACSGEEEPEPEDTQMGACGEPVYGIEMDFRGVVVDAEGAPVSGVEVELRDNSRPPGTTLGSGVSGAEGRFTFGAEEITSIPDCWLTALNYTLEAELDGAEAELLVNRFMWEAIQDDSYAVDLTDRPLELE